MKKKIRWFIVALIFFIPLQVYLVMIWFPDFIKLSGGLANLDSRFSYTVNDVDNLLKSLGQNGIKHYLLGSIIDIFYAFFMSITIFTLYKVIQIDQYNKPLFTILNLTIPLTYLVMDWTENIGIISNLLIYPRLQYSLIPTLSIATSIKQIMPIIALTYLIILLTIRGVYIVTKYRKRKDNKNNRTNNTSSPEGSV